MPEDSTNRVQQTLIEVTRLAFDAGLKDFLLIGGNAVIAYGVPRFTRDIDFVIPERDERPWRALMDANGFELIHGTPAFCQFLDVARIKPRIDLMLVDESTWAKLNESPFIANFGDDLEIPVAAPQHLIAMKLKVHIKITQADLEMVFPEPEVPLHEGPGLPCTWVECMRETAAQTNYWLKHFGPDLSPPPFEDRFSLD